MKKIVKSQSLRKSGQFLYRGVGEIGPRSGCRNPFVNQVSFFKPARRTNGTTKKMSQSLRKSGQFLLDQSPVENPDDVTDTSQSLRKSGQFLYV